MKTARIFCAGAALVFAAFAAAGSQEGQTSTAGATLL